MKKDYAFVKMGAFFRPTCNLNQSAELEFGLFGDKLHYTLGDLLFVSRMFLYSYIIRKYSIFASHSTNLMTLSVNTYLKKNT